MKRKENPTNKQSKYFLNKVNMIYHISSKWHKNVFIKEFRGKLNLHIEKTKEIFRKIDINNYFHSEKMWKNLEVRQK